MAQRAWPQPELREALKRPVQPQELLRAWVQRLEQRPVLVRQQARIELARQEHWGEQPEQQAWPEQQLAQRRQQALRRQVAAGQRARQLRQELCELP
jgi:hypothetical protein